VKILWSIILFLLIGCSSAPVLRRDKLSILQGVTSQREVEFSVVAPVGRELGFELRSAEGEIIKPDEIKTVSRTFSDWKVYKMIFLRDQNKDYNLYAFEGDVVVDQRLIGRGQLNQSQLRLAAISCINDAFQSDFKSWEALIEKNPEYIVMMGDNVYADKTSSGSKIESTPTTLWQRYVEVRLSLPFFFGQKLIPTHALWDDHDYGKNNSNETFPHKIASKEVFDTFFAQNLSQENFTKGHGVGGLLSLGDFNLYFLDARSFRSPEREGEHLGRDQTQWLFQSLRDEGQPSFLIKGDQFFGGHHSFESFEGNHPRAFKDFTSALNKLDTPFIFLSGDRHFSEIMQFPRGLFGIPSFEITSSPMHAKTYPDDGSKNPWRVVHHTGSANFTIIQNLARDNHWFMDVETFDSSGRSLYRRELAVYIKDLQNNLNEVRKRRHGKRLYRRNRR
jgi:alkaline phosphatase D